jgi:hypothetical protein
VWARCAVACHRAACCVRRPRRSRCQSRRTPRRSTWRHRRSRRRYGPSPTSEGTRLFAASALRCESRCTGLSVLRAQSLAKLTEFFPSVSPSAITDALGKAGGDVQQAADFLFKAAQARLRVLGVLGEPSLRQPTTVVRRAVCCRHPHAHARAARRLARARASSLGPFDAVSTHP